jgi:hypothetical protein
LVVIPVIDFDVPVVLGWPGSACRELLCPDRFDGMGLVCSGVEISPVLLTVLELVVPGVLTTMVKGSEELLAELVARRLVPDDSVSEVTLPELMVLRVVVGCVRPGAVSEGIVLGLL